MLIQILRDNRNIIGKLTIIVIIIATKAVFRLEPKIKYEITKAATAKAMPTG